MSEDADVGKLSRFNFLVDHLKPGAATRSLCRELFSLEQRREPPVPPGERRDMNEEVS